VTSADDGFLAPSLVGSLGGHRPSSRTVVAAAVGIVVVGLCLVPMVRLAVAALAPSGVLDPAALIARLSRPATLRAAFATVDTASWGALLSLLIGGPLAVVTTLTDLPGRRAVAFFAVLPLMIAPQVTALAWAHLLGPSSTLLALFGLAPPVGTANPMLGRGGIILLYGVQHTPIVFLTLRAGLAAVPGELVEAARACGTTPLRALLRVVLPLIRPHLVGAFLLAFVSGVGNFGIPALLGLPVGYLTLTTLVYQKVSSFGPGVLPEVAALSLAIAIVAFAGTAVGAAAMTRHRVRLRSGTPIRFVLGAARLPVLAAVGTLSTALLFVPAASLVATALVPTFGVPLTWSTATAANFTEVLFHQAATGRAFVNSFLLSAGAAAFVAAVAIPLGWTVDRAPRPLAETARAIVDLPYAVPGITVAIACILSFLRPLPIVGSLYGTIWIIFVAYAMRFLALAARPVATAIERIPRDLEEAAAACGARPLRRLATIVTPLVGPAATAGGLLAFMSAFNELTVSALLWSSGHETIGVVLFSLEEAGLGTQAAAVAVASLAVVLVVLTVLDRLGRRLPAGILPWR
jgi:iron(III) transport system permease protein